MYGLIMLVGVAMLICDMCPYYTHPVSHDSILHRMVALHALIMAWQLQMSLLGSIGVADVLLRSRDLAPSARRWHYDMRVRG